MYDQKLTNISVFVNAKSLFKGNIVRHLISLKYQHDKNKKQKQKPCIKNYF